MNNAHKLAQEVGLIARSAWYCGSSRDTCRRFVRLCFFRKCSEEWPAVAEVELTGPVPCGTPDGRVFCQQVRSEIDRDRLRHTVPDTASPLQFDPHFPSKPLRNRLLTTSRTRNQVEFTFDLFSWRAAALRLPAGVFSQRPGRIAVKIGPRSCTR